MEKVMPLRSRCAEGMLKSVRRRVRVLAKVRKEVDRRRRKNADMHRHNKYLSFRLSFVIVINNEIVIVAGQIANKEWIGQTFTRQDTGRRSANFKN